MYIGFNLKNIKFEDEDRYKTGKALFKEDAAIIKNKLTAFIDSDGKIDGTSIRNNWFPQIKADIFISHSHMDEKLAISLAGLFYEKLNIKVFIDSCVWGFSDDLLKIIDEYAKLPNGNYFYETRNRTTSHVHMLLSTALNIMIDNTECLLFLNTPQAIIPDDVKLKTFSPWIYSEIMFSQLVRRKSKESHRKAFIKAFSSTERYALNEQFTPAITHDIEIDHLSNIDHKVINAWLEQYTSGHALDKLYDIIGGA